MDHSSQKLENYTVLTLYIQLKFLYLTLCLCNLEMPQIFPKWISLSDNIRNKFKLESVNTKGTSYILVRHLC